MNLSPLFISENVWHYSLSYNLITVRHFVFLSKDLALLKSLESKKCSVHFLLFSSSFELLFKMILYKLMHRDDALYYEMFYVCIIFYIICVNNFKQINIFTFFALLTLSGLLSHLYCHICRTFRPLYASTFFRWHTLEFRSEPCIFPWRRLFSFHVSRNRTIKIRTTVKKISLVQVVRLSHLRNVDKCTFLILMSPTVIFKK